METKLKNIGKRMPYRVPDTFFDKLEQDILNEVQQNTDIAPKKVGTLMFVTKIFAWGGVAACFCLFLYLRENKKKEPYNFTILEQAYGNLNEKDREFLIEIYRDDPFLNSYKDEEYNY